MRKFILLLLVLSITSKVFSQNITIHIDEYRKPAGEAAEQSIIAEMPFGKYNVLNLIGDTSALRSAGEIIIDIICTDYPSTSSLELLNKNRLEEVFRLFPWLNKKDILKVNFLRQMNGAEKEKAVDMFHGVVIRFRPRQTPETMKKDLAKLEEMLDSAENKVTPDRPEEVIKKPESLSEKDSAPLITYTLGSGSKETEPSPRLGRVFLGATSEIIPDLRKRSEAFKAADSVAIMTPGDAFKKGVITDYIYDDFKKYPRMTIYFAPGVSYTMVDMDSLDKDAVIRDTLSEAGYSLNPNFKLPDSTVFKVFTRNKWRNVMIVGDVTGSMYPYTVQLLLWLKLHSMDSFATKFAFFNDGDDTPDNKKIIGKTGGIYPHICNSFDEVKELVKSTMQKGGGGDCPENNIEALLMTEKEFPENKFQVLIADNWAPIKDKKLINRLTKPVRVVLCGTTEFGINVDYLNLARKTGGSIHLMEEDLNTLASMHEGEVITIGRVSFKIVDGEFQEVRNLEGMKNL